MSLRRLRAWASRLGRLFGTARQDRELSDELDSHIQFHIDDGMRAGLTPAEARRQALLALGGLEQAKERYRDRRGLPQVAEFVRDVRHATRILRGHPGFATSAILTLALGIGANTALFSLLDALLLRSLAVQQPEQLVRLLDEGRETWTYPTFDRLRGGTTLLSGVTATLERIRPVQIEERGIPQTVLLHAMSAEYFDLLGVTAGQGRLFHRSDIAAQGDGVAVISESYWRRHYGAEPSAIGTRFRHPYGRYFMIVGVAPPPFRGTLVDAPADIWVPFEQHEPPTSMLWTRGRAMRLLGRLRPGVTAGRAEAEASALLGRKIAVVSGANGFSSSLRGRFSRPLWVLQIVVVLVLLIACANLANLLLARAASREREIAIRRAVGASRGRLVRQLLTESLLVTALGGVLALFVASGLSQSLLAFLPPESSASLANLSFQPGARVLAFTAAVSFATCLLFGLVPAMRATRAASGETLRVRSGSGRGSRTWTNRALIIGEVALCTSLLIGAGLFVRSLQNLLSLDSGFVPEHVLVADVKFPTGYAPTRRHQFHETLRRRAVALPGVQVAGYSRIGQLSGGGIEFSIDVRGRAVPPGTQPAASEQRVSPHFLAAMGTRILSGRDFEDRDAAGAPPVAIVNVAFVREVLRTDRPLGQHFGTNPSTSSSEIEIVGVVEDAKWMNLRETPLPMFYRPVQQALPPEATFALRATGNLEALGQALSREAKAIDEGAALENVVPFTDMVNRTLATERLVAHVSTAFGLLALLIVCVGLYGVLAYGVASRTREIGVRMALGATRSTVRWMVLRESLTLLAVGLPIGVAAALIGTRFIASMLFELAPNDPATIAGTVLLLGVVALAAAYLPARRATRVDPLNALRTD